MAFIFLRIFIYNTSIFGFYLISQIKFSFSILLKKGKFLFRPETGQIRPDTGSSPTSPRDPIPIHCSTAGAPPESRDSRNPSPPPPSRPPHPINTPSPHPSPPLAPPLLTRRRRATSPEFVGPPPPLPPRPGRSSRPRRLPPPPPDSPRSAAPAQTLSHRPGPPKDVAGAPPEPHHRNSYSESRPPVQIFFFFLRSVFFKTEKFQSRKIHS